MNTPKCIACNDTGSRDKLGTYLDCNACGTAAIRRDLNDFVKSLGPTHPEDAALAIHQRALAMGMSASVEDTLNEMQPGGALHMPQEPVAHLKFWAVQSWSGNGNHDIDCGEGLEVCEPGEIGADGLPAFPVFMHAIPGALAMAPKQEAPEPVAQDCGACHGSGWVSRDADIGTEQECFSCDGSGKSDDAAPAAANGAEDIKDMAQARRVITQLRAAAGPDAALVTALEGTANLLASLGMDSSDEYQSARASLSGAKGN